MAKANVIHSGHTATICEIHIILTSECNSKDSRMVIMQGTTKAAATGSSMQCSSEPSSRRAWAQHWSACHAENKDIYLLPDDSITAAWENLLKPDWRIVLPTVWHFSLTTAMSMWSGLFLVLFLFVFQSNSSGLCIQNPKNICASRLQGMHRSLNLKMKIIASDSKSEALGNHDRWATIQYN